MLVIRLEFVMVVIAVMEDQSEHQKKRSQCLTVVVEQMQQLEAEAVEFTLAYQSRN